MQLVRSTCLVVIMSCEFVPAAIASYLYGVSRCYAAHLGCQWSIPKISLHNGFSSDSSSRRPCLAHKRTNQKQLSERAVQLRTTNPLSVVNTRVRPLVCFEFVLLVRCKQGVIEQESQVPFIGAGVPGGCPLVTVTLTLVLGIQLLSLTKLANPGSRRKRTRWTSGGRPGARTWSGRGGRWRLARRMRRTPSCNARCT